MAIEETGPPYPPPPGAGTAGWYYSGGYTSTPFDGNPPSNALGSFGLGIEQLGDIPPFNIWATIISQYANSPILTQLILNWDAYLDQTQNFDQLYDYIWNVDTAQGYGLDVWGRIVGINRVLQVVKEEYFGFKEALPGSLPFNTDTFLIPQYFGFAESNDANPFNQVAFYNGGSLALTLVPSVQGGGRLYSGEFLTDSFTLDDQTYRTLIFAKAAFNITNGSIPAINQIMINLFPGQGNCYVTEGVKPPSFFGFEEGNNYNPFNQAPLYEGEDVFDGNMTMTYTFEFSLTPLQLAIAQSGVLLKPCGVAHSIVIKPR